jgi:hypothetical protein
MAHEYNTVREAAIHARHEFIESNAVREQALTAARCELIELNAAREQTLLVARSEVIEARGVAGQVEMVARNTQQLEHQSLLLLTSEYQEQQQLLPTSHYRGFEITDFDQKPVSYSTLARRTAGTSNRRPTSTSA